MPPRPIIGEVSILNVVVIVVVCIVDVLVDCGGDWSEIGKEGRNDEHRRLRRRVKGYGAV